MTQVLNLLEELFNPSSACNDSIFYQLIGLENESSYNHLLTLFNQKLSTPGRGLIFSNGISLSDSNKLIGRNLYGTVDFKIKSALDSIASLTLSKETFSSHFMAQLITWCNLYIDGLNFNDDIRPKCLFYGSIQPCEAYFLILLAQIGVDVLYFNPTNDTTLSQIDTEGRCTTLVLGNISCTLIPYLERIQATQSISNTTSLPNGLHLERVTTYAKQATHALEQILYQDTGIYKPWQFSDGLTQPVFMDSVIEDTLTYWNEPAKLRPGFKTIDKMVHTPTFFTKISGIYQDENDYYTLIQTLKSGEHFIFYESPHLASMGLGQSRTIRYHNLPDSSYTRPPSKFSPKDLDDLASCLSSNHTIDREKLKQLAIYQKMMSLRMDVQNFILSKLEETFLLDTLDFFCFPIENSERIRLMATIFTAQDHLLHLIEGYDFTSNIPKIILYINSKEPFYQEDALLLGLLHRMGFDILLLSPNGASNIEQMISKSFINDIKLDRFVQNFPLKTPIKKRSFFSKLFK